MSKLRKPIQLSLFRQEEQPKPEPPLRADRQRKLDARLKIDPEAPWGRRKNGQPKKKPGLRRGASPRTPEERKIALLEQDRIYQKERRDAMSPDERAEMYAKNYQRNKNKPWMKNKLLRMTDRQKAELRERDKKWRLANPEIAKEVQRKASRKWRESNIDAVMEKEKKWRENNKDKIKAANQRPAGKQRRAELNRTYRESPEYRAWECERGRMYRKNNPHKMAAKDSAKRAARVRATPKWVDKAAIHAVFAERNRLTQETGICHAVDHIVPLRSPIVCGLHIHQNMRVITHAENLSKGNRFIESLAVAPTRANGLLRD